MITLLSFKGRGCAILLVYVDDIIISGNDALGIKELKRYLMQTFKMKDLDHLTHYLGLKINHTREGIQVHRCKYA